MITPKDGPILLAQRQFESLTRRSSAAPVGIIVSPEHACPRICCGTIESQDGGSCVKLKQKFRELTSYGRRAPQLSAVPFISPVGAARISGRYLYARRLLILLRGREISMTDGQVDIA